MTKFVVALIPSCRTFLHRDTDLNLPPTYPRLQCAIATRDAAEAMTFDTFDAARDVASRVRGFPDARVEEIATPEPAPEPIDPETLQEVLDGYQACATWSAVPLSEADGPYTFDDLGFCEWSPEAEAECRSDCESFIRDNLPALLRVTDATDYTWERVGHDFWLSRNGHGAGFFDRVSATHKHHDDFDALQEAASAWGEVNLDLTEPDAEGEQRIAIA